MANKYGALTARQIQCATIIYDYFLDHGYWPTHQYVAEQMGGIRQCAIKGHLLSLSRKDVMETIPGTMRAFRILPGFKTILDLKGSNYDVSAWRSSPGTALEELRRQNQLHPGGMDKGQDEAHRGGGSVRKD